MRKRLMPEKFDELASYNTRVSEGIVHTKEYKKRMRYLQEEYNEWILEDNKK